MVPVTHQILALDQRRGAVDAWPLVEETTPQAALDLSVRRKTAPGSTAAQVKQRPKISAPVMRRQQGSRNRAPRICGRRSDIGGCGVAGDRPWVFEKRPPVKLVSGEAAAEPECRDQDRPRYGEMAKWPR